MWFCVVLCGLHCAGEGSWVDGGDGLGLGGCGNHLIGWDGTKAVVCLPGWVWRRRFFLFFLFLCGFVLSIPKINVSVLWRMDESVVGGLLGGGVSWREFHAIYPLHSFVFLSKNSSHTLPPFHMPGQSSSKSIAASSHA